jgi:transcriptional regulator with XRE-family HTH domain
VRDLEIGQLVRLLRRRRGWRQSDLSARAGVHRSVISLIERGAVERVTLATLRRVLEALEVRLDLRPLWRGPQLDRLLDADHADLGAAWKLRLERWGWIVRIEVSFSRYGERGRIDLLAWHPVLRILLVIEIKTDLVDVQELLGALDVKTRNARYAAVAVGWSPVALLVPVIVFKEDRTVRRRLAHLDSLFDRFALRGRAATTWLHRPSGRPQGLLIFSDLTAAALGRVSRGGRQRVRVPTPRVSVAGSPRAPRVVAAAD